MNWMVAIPLSSVGPIGRSIPMPDICPACGSPIDYCIGHGEIGDPRGNRILENHDYGDHTNCHPHSDCKDEEV